MDDVVTPAAAARLALAAEAGGPAVALVTVVGAPEGGAGRALLGRRVALLETGELRGTLGGGALDARAVELGWRVLAGEPPGAEEVDADGARFTFYAEACFPPEELLVVGAGHIAVPLAELGVRLGFRVTVLDDREEFATDARFPGAARVLRVDFADPFRELAIGPRTYIVLVTRAHRYDFDCLKQLVELEAAPRYIGMIGSRRRVRAAFHAMLEAGIPRERLARVRAPLGIDIGAETPEEIAVSIAAELIAVRRGGAALDASLAARENVLERLLPETARGDTRTEPETEESDG
ncbi:MAG TPA: XdhC/CoxI family protein [Longimicrobiales bacterium]